MSQIEVVHAYRHLYRALLQAVQYSAPARFTARDQLRRAFRGLSPLAPTTTRPAPVPELNVAPVRANDGPTEHFTDAPELTMEGSGRSVSQDAAANPSIDRTVAAAGNADGDSSPAAVGERASIGNAAPILDVEGVERTLAFLRAAARERGMEHRIVKNLLRTQWEREALRARNGIQWRARWARRKQSLERGKQPVADMTPLLWTKETAYVHYDMTVAMLNKTLGTLLR